MNRGRRRSPVLHPTLLRTTLTPRQFVALGLSRRQMRKVVGFKPFSSCTLERGQIRQDIPLVYHYPIHNSPIHNHPEVSLAPFYGLLPVLKSIRLAFNLFQNSQISVLIHPSFLHKDLTLSGRTIGNGGPYPDTDVDGPSSNFRLCPHLPVPSTSSYSKRWNTSSVGYCAHKTVFTLESSDCRGLRRMAFDG